MTALDFKKKPLELKLHSNAVTSVEEYVKQYADIVILQSKNLASIDGTDEVQAVHVQKAKDFVLSANVKKNKTSIAMIAIGGLFLGIAIQGFVAEISANPPRVGFASAYFATALIALIVLIIGIAKS